MHPDHFDLLIKTVSLALACYALAVFLKVLQRAGLLEM